MRAAADAEMMVRRRQAEVGKEAVRHVDVIVLSGMDQCRHAPVLPLKHVVERRNLHEVGQGPGEKVNHLKRLKDQYPRMCPIREASYREQGSQHELNHVAIDLSKKTQKPK